MVPPNFIMQLCNPSKVLGNLDSREGDSSLIIQKDRKPVFSYSVFEVHIKV